MTKADIPALDDLRKTLEANLIKPGFYERATYHDKTRASFAVELLAMLDQAAALSRTPGEAAVAIENPKAAADAAMAERVAARLDYLADGAWCDERTMRIAAKWIRHLVKRAHPAPAAPAGEIEALLSAYDAKTELIPLGHENIGLGASSYGWRKAVTKELRALRATLSASPAPGAIAPGVEIAKLIEAMRAKHGQWRYWDGEHTVFTSLPEQAVEALATAERDATERAAKIAEAESARARRSKEVEVREAFTANKIAAAIRSGEKA
jgi:hypothetical protein